MVITMKKLIELDAALDALREVIVPAEDIGFGDELTEGYNDGIDMAITVLGGLPTVDAVQVRHGHWIRHENADIVDGYYVPNYECSVCHAWKQDDSDYCPDCGALNDGKDSDND